MGATAGATAGATDGATDGATATPGEPLALVKRQAPAAEPTGCVLYRYGTFSAQLDIVRECRGPGGGPGGAGPALTPRPLAEGVESVAIVQVVPVVPEGSGNSVELTVTCEGR